METKNNNGQKKIVWTKTAGNQKLSINENTPRAMETEITDKY